MSQEDKLDDQVLSKGAIMFIEEMVYATFWERIKFCLNLLFDRKRVLNFSIKYYEKSYNTTYSTERED